jgi:hypothetical protein|nr:MAG TPA: hypothetical protein [Caudoviricetes sp.]
MSDWDSMVWRIMSLIAILLFGAIIGSIAYIWIISGPLIVKVIWTTCMVVLSLIVLALALVID